MILLPRQRAALLDRSVLSKLACVAGEPSGDLLASSVLRELTQLPNMVNLEIYGVGGPLMQNEGLHSKWPMEILSVRGYVEALKQLPKILRLRHELILYLLGAGRPDVYLGIDAPDFNLGVEINLKAAGIPILHFVSPSIWAWRSGRIQKIKQAVDRMLCIFPFETAIYEKEGVSATYVGHPLASSIPLMPKPDEARKRIANYLAIESNNNCPKSIDGVVIAVLPGSRGSEIELIAPIFFETMRIIASRLHGQTITFLIPVAAPHLRRPLEALLQKIRLLDPSICIHLMDGQADAILESADVVLIASGTATLQAALWKKPMVISYKVPWLTAQIMKRQGYLPYIGLPNILCGDFILPELLQDEAKPDALADSVLGWLDQPARVAALQSRFLEMHELLRRPTGVLVAEAIAQTISKVSRF